MKLGNDVLVEIVDVFLRGLRDQRDVSELMRELDLSVEGEKLCLSEAYKARVGRSDKQVLKG